MNTIACASEATQSLRADPARTRETTQVKRASALASARTTPAFATFHRYLRKKAPSPVPEVAAAAHSSVQDPVPSHPTQPHSPRPPHRSALHPSYPTTRSASVSATMLARQGSGSGSSSASAPVSGCARPRPADVGPLILTAHEASGGKNSCSASYVSWVWPLAN